MAGAFVGGMNSAMSLAGSIGGALVRGHQNRKFAREQRAYATDLANTAYQRSVTDMKSAGLNPIVMYGQGGGGQMSASPQGPMAESGQMENPASALASTQLARQQKAQVGAQVGLTGAQTTTTAKQGALADAQSDKAKAEAEMIRANLPKAQIKSQLYKGVYDYIAPYSARSESWAAERTAIGPDRLGPEFGKAKRSGAHQRHRRQLEAKRNY